MTEAESRDDKTFAILLKQLEMCWADKRNYETMIWQTPAISLGIIAVLLAGILSAKSLGAPSKISTWIFLLATLLVFGIAFGIGLVGLIQLRKHWFFAIARTYDIDGITRNLSRFGVSYPVKFRTRDVQNDSLYYRGIPRTWANAQEAHKWLDALMLLVLITLGAMAVLLVVSLIV